MNMATETFVKGDRVRLVDTPAQRVAAVWEGFQPAAEVSTETYDRVALQTTAKQLGIKANQSNEALAKAIADFKPSEDGDAGENPDAPETDDDGSVVTS